MKCINFSSFDIVDPSLKMPQFKPWCMKVNSRAGLAVQPAVFSSVRFSGVLFVNSTYDNDLVGIIFGYQNHKNFYTLTSSMTGSRQVHNDQLESVFHEKNRVTGSWPGSSHSPGTRQWNCRWKSVAQSGSLIEFLLTAGGSFSILIEFLLTQRAIFVLGNRNNKSVPGQTHILWQHPKVGWKVIQSHHFYNIHPIS